MEFGASEAQLVAVEAEVAAEVESATEEAKAGAVPGEDLLMKRRMGGRRVIMAQLTYREAIARGIAQEMRRDDSVVMIGEDIGAAGGVFKGTVGLLDEFGPVRVRDTPISEQAILGAAMGAAMTGLRPVAEIMFADFFAVCWDIVANEIAKSRYMTNGQIDIPLGDPFGQRRAVCVSAPSTPRAWRTGR